MKLFAKGTYCGKNFEGEVECDTLTEKYAGLVHRTNGKIDIDWREWVYFLESKDRPRMAFPIRCLTQFDVIEE